MWKNQLRQGIKSPNVCGTVVVAKKICNLIDLKAFECHAMEEKEYSLRNLRALVILMASVKREDLKKL